MASAFRTRLWPLAPALAMALLWVVCRVDSAAAEPAEPLKCFRIDDRSDGGAVVDVTTLALGAAQGCRVLPRSRMLCLPSQAVVPTGDPSSDAGGASNSAQLCYRLRCSGSARPALQVQDRFGTRTVSVTRARKICTPARPSGDAAADQALSSSLRN